MRKVLLFLLSAVVCNSVMAQNVGIGTTEPFNKFQIQGNLLVNISTKATNTAPTAGQTKTMLNAGSITYFAADSTGRFYDPGGSSGNYLPNLTADAVIATSGTTIGIEVTAETMQLGTGDSLIIKETSSSTENLLAVGNGYSSTAKWIFNTSRLYLIFKSNADANTGTGFSLLFKRLYADPFSLTDVQGIAGSAMFFETKTGAIRSGKIAAALRGTSSVAMGNSNTASGSASTAMGSFTEATNTSSTAMGNTTVASGFASTAMGGSTEASGNYSTAMGNGSIASGESSISTGAQTIARGYASVVTGVYNDPIVPSPQTISTATSTTPLFIIGNGDDDANRSNAMVALKNGNIGIGTNAPLANLHIKHIAGGGILLENANDGNKWRIYSASGDNHLTFYNNAGTEVADIDDVTGTYNAISDSRTKKNILPVNEVLPLLMKLRPTYYHFNWQHPNEQRQIGMLAQDANKLFPELVSYSKEKDLYKMNYAGFSTIAIKAIQEQQLMIQNQQQQIDELKALVKSLLQNK